MSGPVTTAMFPSERTEDAAALDAKTMESVLLHGDLSKLSESQRLSYYRNVCDSLGLNPLTKPFDYLTLQGKMILYARKDCAEQLRRIRGVSIDSVKTERIGDVYVVTATARDKSGRVDASTGAVTIGNLKGDALANAIMKAETKAKRRVTLSICGLGMLDETEVETSPGARTAAIEAPSQPRETVNVETGEVVEVDQPVKPEGYDDWLADMIATADDGEAALRKAWVASCLEYRAYITTYEPETWADIKVAAKGKGA